MAPLFFLGGVEIGCGRRDVGGSKKAGTWMRQANRMGTANSELRSSPRPIQGASEFLGCCPRMALRLSWAIFVSSLREDRVNRPGSAFEVYQSRLPGEEAGRAVMRKRGVKLHV